VQLPYTFPSPLATKRLVQRFMTAEDVDDIHAYQSREDVTRYLLYTPRDRAAVAEKVAQFGAARTLGGDGDFWQLAMLLDGRVIGDVYFTIKSVEQQTGEIGWTMHPDFHGNGYMSEAALAVLGVGFRDVGLRRVIANLDPRNVASAALCRRLGMREEAHHVEDMWSKGEWTDSRIYALLAREWPELSGRSGPAPS
jgi:RimJ/RimL family protein N-acetyltransferase